MKRYTFSTADDKDTFIELEQRFDWNKLVSDNPTEMINPGPFHGSFYFFHLDDLGSGESSAAAAGLGINRSLIKEMSGVSILRDGFTVRSQGDWLGISGGMTSGSIYHMRVDNTIGYFALTGEKNYKLVEKSDREGFVDDTAHRGFVQIAKTCKDFANDALENIRRAFDEYFHQLGQQKSNSPPKTAASSLRHMEQAAQQSRDAKNAAEKAAASLAENLEKLKSQAQAPSTSATADQNSTANQALDLVEQAVKAINSVQQKLDSKKIDSSAINQLKHELQSNKEQISALYESAAVGLSARGLSHELRTHLSEIKSRTALIQKQIKDATKNETNILSHLKSIRAACTGIASAAALIDPMLPRSRALKETIDLKEFVSDYVAAREFAFQREQITVHQSASPPPSKVRSNRARLLQILDNLVRNSVYWLKRGEYTKETVAPKQITININDGILTIWDSGPGVDRDYEDSIFDIFVTAKPVSDSGQGLGLFIVTQLLALDGCDVMLSSERNNFGRLYKFNINLQPITVRG
jgi:signal transduction histidine kinase